MRETISMKTSTAIQTKFREHLDKTLEQVVKPYEAQYAESENLLSQLHDELIDEWTAGRFLQDPEFIQAYGTHRMSELLKDMDDDHGYLLDDYLWDLLQEEADAWCVYLDDQAGYEDSLREAWEEQQFENRIADQWLHG